MDGDVKDQAVMWAWAPRIEKLCLARSTHRLDRAFPRIQGRKLCRAKASQFDGLPGTKVLCERNGGADPVGVPERAHET